MSGEIENPVEAETPQIVLADPQKRTVVSVANPRWANVEHTMLDADIVFQEMQALGPIPFTANADADTAHGREIWQNANECHYGAIEAYVAPPPTVPFSVTARQFKLALHAASLLEQVGAWVAQQDPAIRIAYENSSTFVRAEPMMQAGFTGLGFTAEQVDAFFVAAAEL